MIIPTTLNFAYIYKSEEHNIYSSGYSVLEVFKGHWLLMMVMSAMLALYAFIYHHYGKGVKNLDLKLLLIFIVICMVGVPPLFVWVMRTYQHDFHQTLDAKALYLVFLGAMLTVFSIAAAMAETHKVKKQRFFSNVRVVLKNGASIHSTETLYFIGMTKNYFFIYDNRRKSCTVHRIESFETMVFEKS